MMRNLNLILVITIFFSFVNFGYGQEPRGSYEKIFNIPAFKMKQFAKELGISKNQLEKIRNIRFQAMKKIIPLNAEVKVKELEIREAMAPKEPDTAKVFKIADEIGALRIRITKTWLKATIEMKKILTEEQMNKLVQTMEKFKRKHRNQMKRNRMKRIPPGMPE